MLDSLYQTVCRPFAPPQPLSAGEAWGMWLLLSLSAAVTLAALWGGGGAWVALGAVVLCGAMMAGWFWLTAAVGALAPQLGGTGPTTASPGLLAAAFWPILLAGPVAAIAPLWPRTATMLALGLGGWILAGLARHVAYAHQLSWGRAAWCLILASWAAVAGLTALFILPLVLAAWWALNH